MHVTPRTILADDVLKCGPCPRTELMSRREFIAALGGAAVLPLAARAQQQPVKVWRVGYLTPELLRRLRLTRAREIAKLVDIHRCLHTGDEQGQPAHWGRSGTVWSSQRGRLGEEVSKLYVFDVARARLDQHPPSNGARA
jgi:hypothetical protein